MADEEMVLMMLVDSAGSYYLLEEEALTRARIPDERKPAFDRLLAGDDTTGLLFQDDGAAIGGRLAVVGALRLPVEQNDVTGYMLDFPNLFPVLRGDPDPVPIDFTRDGDHG